MAVARRAETLSVGRRLERIALPAYFQQGRRVSAGLKEFRRRLQLRTYRAQHSSICLAPSIQAGQSVSSAERKGEFLRH